jgi:hypothetical protein
MDNGRLTIKNGEKALKQKSYSFDLNIVKVCLVLQEKREFVSSKQLLRSGPAVGALVEEQTKQNQELILFTNYPSPIKKPMKPNIG